MTRSYPLQMGVALAATVGIGYALCTVVFWLWPDAAANFMNALFHGLDFRKLRADGALFTFNSFAYGFTILVAWALMLGALFGWIANRLGAAR